MFRVNGEIPRRSVAPCNLGRMAEADFSWTGLHEPHERLRWARERKYRTGDEFAKAIGWDPNRYRNHEREPGKSRNTRITAEKAMLFGARLDVRWEWLFEEDGQPWRRERDDTPKARLLRALEDADEEEQERIATAVETLRGKTGTRG